MSYSHSGIREMESASIYEFVDGCSDHLAGRVLDFGCGKQPYRSVVEAAGGEYVPYDRLSHPANVSGADVGEEPVPGARFDAVLCTQVAQYWPDPLVELLYFHAYLRADGHLVMTYPTNWDEVEPADLWRFTRWGMEKLLREAGFTIDYHERRAEVELSGFRFPLGYGVLAHR